MELRAIGLLELTKKSLQNSAVLPSIMDTSRSAVIMRLYECDVSYASIR